eukprot:SAG11_NODE_774_length_7236_cov_2.593807_10_plen_94_part_00
MHAVGLGKKLVAEQAGQRSPRNVAREYENVWLRKCLAQQGEVDPNFVPAVKVTDFGLTREKDMRDTARGSIVVQVWTLVPCCPRRVAEQPLVS